MSRRVGNVVVLAVEKQQQCDLCGVVAELRPYGPGGSCICFACGMKDRVGTDTRMGVSLFGMPESEARAIAERMPDPEPPRA